MLSLNVVSDQIKEILWRLIEQHYNVDRAQPQSLTAKTILLGKNPIDKIGEDLGEIMEEMLKQTLEEYIQAQILVQEDSKSSSLSEDDDQDRDTPPDDGGINPFGWYTD